jgi:tRNA(fMet)-specific endonuclease VapC
MAPQTVVTSIVVVAELKFGAVRKASKRLMHDIEAVLGSIEVLPFDTPADQTYARLRTELERAGTPISGNDMFIAAHALALDCVLVTDNEREFSRVAGLRIENWIR